MPMPVSHTLKRMVPSAASTVTSKPTEPLSGVNFTAFAKRFPSICFSRRESANTVVACVSAMKLRRRFLLTAVGFTNEIATSQIAETESDS